MKLIVGCLAVMAILFVAVMGFMKGIYAAKLKRSLQMVTKGDKRARSLLLKPRSRHTKAQQGLFVIEPKLDDASLVEIERVRSWVNYNNTGKFT